MAIEVIDLHKHYHGQHAVDGISFTAVKGQITGFLGPNGAGKSTTMKIATGYIPPTSGTIVVGGIDVQKEPLAVKKKVGYLPEHNPLYLDQYVHEYLRFIGSLHSLKGSYLNERVNEMIAQTGLTREQHKKIGALSKGYRQRVGLAQSMIHDPEVLILDEPTTGLDPNQIVEIRALIKNFSKDKTVVFSTHVMQEVQALCDKVVIINRGKIVADASIAALQQQFTHPRLMVKLDGEISITLLSAIPGVREVKKNSALEYVIEMEEHQDVRSALLTVLAANQRMPLEMKMQEVSLESIFSNLTSKP